MLCTPNAAYLPLFMALLLTASSDLGAATIEVPGDFSTIQAGINAAGAGDTVSVAPGTYIEEIFMRDSVLVRSGQGAQVTTIEGNGMRRLVNFDNVRDATLEGFRLRYGISLWHPGGAGILMVNATGRVADSVIESNLAWFQSGSGYGGGIAIAGNSDVIIEGNIIAHNESDRGGAGIAVLGGHASIVGNVIHDNRIVAAPFGSGESGGGIYLPELSGTTCEIYRNVIYRNEASGMGGGISCGADAADISHNTIVGNRAHHIFGPGPYPWGKELHVIGNAPTIRNNIIGSLQGVPVEGTAVFCDAVAPIFSHNDVWNDPAIKDAPEFNGDCPDPTGTDGNISADPLFCDPGNDLELFEDSPCAGTGEGGSDMGALPVGCGTASVGIGATEATSWGRLRNTLKVASRASPG